MTPCSGPLTPAGAWPAAPLSVGFPRVLGGRGEGVWGLLEGAERQKEDEMSEKVRVRIAVAIAANGKWSAIGGSSASDEQAAEIALDDLGNESGVEEWALRNVVFVEADAPLPEPPEPLTVEGEVVAEGESAGGEP